MTQKLKDVFPGIQSTRCHESGCTVNLKSSDSNQKLFAYSAKDLAGIVGPQEEGQKICDCIIFNQTEEEVTLVELKYRSGKKGILKGTGKAGRIDDVIKQFEDSLYVLYKILHKMKRPHIQIQATLFTKTLISNYTEKEKLRGPLCCISAFSIQNMKCGNTLPRRHLRISVDKLHR